MQSPAHFQNLQVLAIQAQLQHQNFARSVLQSHLSNSQKNKKEDFIHHSLSSDTKKLFQEETVHSRFYEENAEDSNDPLGYLNMSSLITTLTDVLETARIDQISRARVMAIVRGLITHILRVKNERDKMVLLIQEMDKKKSQLEEDLKEHQQNKEKSSSDVNVESGTEVDVESLSDKSIDLGIEREQKKI